MYVRHDHLERFAGGEAGFSFCSTLRPGVRAGKRRRRLRPDRCEKRLQRLATRLRHAPCRIPHVAQTDDEVPPRTPSDELVATMQCAEPHRHPERQVQLLPCPVPRPSTDRARRLLPEALALVVADRHTPKDAPSSVSPQPPNVSILTRLCDIFRHTCRLQWRLRDQHAIWRQPCHAKWRAPNAAPARRACAASRAEAADCRG